jgi:hypothetical protein
MSASYRDLRVWQNAMDLVVNVYHETQGFPREELYGLTSQMRRASVSIPSNIAEAKDVPPIVTEPCSFVMLVVHCSNWKLRF